MTPVTCRNCGAAIVEVAPGRWWHADTQHAWCGFRYDNTKTPPMPYPIPESEHAAPN